MADQYGTVYRNGVIYTGGSGGSGSGIESVTQAEYDALPESQKNSGAYYISDAEPSANISASNVRVNTTDTSFESNNVQGVVEEIDDAISELNENLTKDEVTFHFDCQDGVYGWNESATRGADTFHPFKSGMQIGSISVADTTTWYEVNLGYKPSRVLLLCPYSYGGQSEYGIDFDLVNGKQYLYIGSANHQEDTAFTNCCIATENGFKYKASSTYLLGTTWYYA